MLIGSPEQRYQLIILLLPNMVKELSIDHFKAERENGSELFIAPWYCCGKGIGPFIEFYEIEGGTV